MSGSHNNYKGNLYLEENTSDDFNIPHAEDNQFVSNKLLLKEFANELKHSVISSKKAISDETSKNFADRFNVSNCQVSSFNDPDSILNFDLKVKKSKQITQESNVVTKTSLKPQQNVSNQKIFEKKEKEQKKWTKEKQEKFESRVKENLEKKRMKITAKAAILKEEDTKINKVRPPEINKTSKKIMETKIFKQKPIGDRAKDILEQRDFNLNQLKKMYIKEEENRIAQRTSSVGRIEKYDKKKFDDWVGKQMDWVQGKTNKISKIAETQEKSIVETQRNLRFKNSSVDRSIISDVDRDQIFERLSNANVGNIKLSKLVKYHGDSLSSTPIQRSPKFKKDFVNRSLNNSFETKPEKIAKFYSNLNSPRRQNNKVIEAESQFISNPSALNINIEEQTSSVKEISSMLRINREKFSYLRSNSVVSSRKLN